MVRWNIEKTALWKEKDTDKKTFEMITKQDNLGLNLLFAIGSWAVWQQIQKEKKAKKEVFGAVIMTTELVKECFADKKEGANSFVIGGLDDEQEAFLRHGMDKLVGAEFW